jgi:nucleotide-binding universal stress UspA family protein
MSYRTLLLASHGTPGAQAAETLAIDLCAPGAHLYHLLVVPDLWRGMMGDDWLNNVRTRIAFGNYLEAELSREIGEHLERVSHAAAARGLTYSPEVRQGDPADCLVAYSREQPCELVVLGAPRPKGTEGLRSRMRLETLVRGLAAPLLVVPYPRA